MKQTFLQQTCLKCTGIFFINPKDLYCKSEILEQHPNYIYHEPLITCPYCGQINTSVTKDNVGVEIDAN